MQGELLEKLAERWSARSPVEIANSASAPLFGTAGEWELPAGVEPKRELLYLAVGIPDAESLPKQEFRAASERVLTKPGDLALRYGFGQGPSGLRDWLAARRSEQEGFPVTGDWSAVPTLRDWGVVWDCVPPEALIDSARAYARRLGSVPSATVLATRALVDEAGQTGFVRSLEDERLHQRELCDAPVFMESVRRFMGKG